MNNKQFKELIGESVEDMGIDLEEWDCGCDGIEPCEYCRNNMEEEEDG